MVAVKSEKVARRFASPDAVPPICLVFGPDRGHVSQIAGLVAETVLKGSDDPFALVAIAGDDIASDPGRLSDEARTISMFGGRRLVWVKDVGAKNIAPAVEPLVDDPPSDAVVLIEAGDLKRTAPLRKRLETHRHAVAIACYADTAAQLDRLIDAEANALGLAVDREAREILHVLLGGDRLASRGEVAKLCLYALGEGTIRAHHVREIVGDVSSFTAGEAVDAAFLGDAATLDRELQKLRIAGTHASVVAGTALRWAQTLLRASLDVAAGTEPRGALERMAPPVHFQRRTAVLQMLETWRPQRVEAVARHLDETVLQSRRNAYLGDAIVSAALHRVAMQVPKPRRR